jgi:hypothetical protein
MTQILNRTQSKGIKLKTLTKQQKYNPELPESWNDALGNLPQRPVLWLDQKKIRTKDPLAYLSRVYGPRWRTATFNDRDWIVSGCNKTGFHQHSHSCTHGFPIGAADELTLEGSRATIQSFWDQREVELDEDKY